MRLTILLLMTAAAALASPQDEGKRVALIIGNDAYSISPLRNAVNDARAVDRALQGAGFKTKLLENASKDQIDDAVGVFADSLGPDDTALFYYAGHAFQIENDNFLVPVDFKPAAGVTQAKNRCVSLSQLFEELKRARAKVRIVILDACRGNPIAEQYSLAAGLAQPLNAGKESYIAFSTGPNQVAGDNPDGKNSWFSEALADFISQPGLTVDVNEVFNRVRKRVQAETDGHQTPWSQSSLSNNFYFHAPLKEDAGNDPTLIERWLEDARHHEQREDWAGAIDLVNQVLKKKPSAAVEADARKKLAYLTARRDAQTTFEAADFAKAASLYEQAFTMDLFSIEAAFQAANSQLLNDNLPEAVRLLKTIRVRGTSESIRKANAILQELAAVYPEAGQELKAGIPQPPPVEEVFSGSRFGVPDWEAGARLTQSSPVEIGRWNSEVAAAFTPPAVMIVTPAQTTAQTTGAATPAPVSPSPTGAPTTPATAAPATAAITEHPYHLEVISVGGTRELDYSAVTEAPTATSSVRKPASPRVPKSAPPTPAEVGFVEFEGASDTAVLVNGKPVSSQDAQGKLQLAPGTYEIRAVREGQIVSRKSVEVKAGATTKIAMK